MVRWNSEMHSAADQLWSVVLHLLTERLVSTTLSKPKSPSAIQQYRQRTVTEYGPEPNIPSKT